MYITYFECRVSYLLVKLFWERSPGSVCKTFRRLFKKVWRCRSGCLVALCSLSMQGMVACAHKCRPIVNYASLIRDMMVYELFDSTDMQRYGSPEELRKKGLWEPGRMAASERLHAVETYELKWSWLCDGSPIKVALGLHKVLGGINGANPKNVTPARTTLVATMSDLEAQ